MAMYNLIEYSVIYLKTLRNLWQYYTDEPADNIADFRANKNNSTLFKLKNKITQKTGNDDKKDVKIMAPLKHLSNIWRTLEMPIISFEINLRLKTVFKLVFSCSCSSKLRAKI